MYSDNFHSQLVAWMKIILPIAALALLSTLFLISRGFDPSKSVPVATIDLKQRAQDQGATNAEFSGVTSGGDQVRIQAKRAQPSTDNTRRILAEDVSAQLHLTSGTVIDILAKRADMDQAENTAALEGEIQITTTTGYIITTDRITARFDDLYAETPGPVAGTGPIGDLTAGRMMLTGNSETNDADLLFTDGVKLIYKPLNPEE